MSPVPSAGLGQRQTQERFAGGLARAEGFRSVPSEVGHPWLTLLVCMDILEALCALAVLPLPDSVGLTAVCQQALPVATDIPTVLTVSVRAHDSLLQAALALLVL